MSTRARALTALGGGALLAAGSLMWAMPADRGAPAPTAAAAATPGLAWHPGERRCWRLQLDSTAQVGVAAGGARQEFAQSISGTLHMRVFAVADGEVAVGMQLSPARYVVAGQAIPRRERQLQLPFVVRFATDGTPRGFTFGRGLDPETPALLEETVRTFQCVVPADAGERWQSEEAHGSGSYRAIYARQADGLHKRKIGYVAGGTRVVRSTARFVLDDRASWIARAEIDDALVTVVGGEAMARVASRGVLEPEVADPAEALAAARAPADLLLACTDAAAAADGDARGTVAMTPADRARFEATLGRYHACGGDDVEMMLALRDQIAAVPELARLVPDILRGGELHDRAAAGLLHVLELAGHAAAQAALGEVLADARIPHMNRIRAVIALGGVAAPGPDAIARLWATVDDRAGAEAMDLGRTALLSVGRVGRALRAVDARRYDDEIRAPLLASLQRSQDDEATTIALKAIGNARDPGFADHLTPNLAAPSAAVRAAAAEALGSIGAADAVPDLVGRLRVEPDGRVRAALVAGLAELDRPDPETLATVDALVAHEADGDARFAMARYLVDHLADHTPARATLRTLLATETEPRILRYVAGRLYRTAK